ncbi:hypothetical protein NDU88_002886 [Pleurodeles waltl]|uniref:Uncharacterized protein n=1 Tax=Pleurodeles waltl TaxID=8319 RepID=A0AAV7NF12_PLEWA|nr:hypothetical protein NDU88_002886 [Pleurodeles waltl]
MHRAPPPAREVGLPPAALGPRVPTSTGRPESTGGPRRGRDHVQAAPPARAGRHVCPRMRDRPVRRARPPISSRAAGPHQRRAARVHRRPAPGTRLRSSGSACSRRSS